MKSSRIAIFGNSGSGKSTLARQLAERFGLKHLDLDGFAWTPDIQRQPLDESIAAIRAALAGHDGWVVEGCYADLIEPLLPACTRVVFLNPGVERCIANCRARPWEPEKYATPEEQDARLDFLLGWVRDYETRTDEFSLRSHRALFEGFTGEKDEIREMEGAADVLG